ncbi:MAG: FKBP-type peptidyl-prolyl cis-trans isomerase [Bacteroidales bacterium]|nr:FKBP-type peptidyl-prolyl cis-trans isomerase [Bacteroidales bacterium]
MKAIKFMAVAAAAVLLAASCNSGSSVKGVEAQLPTKAETDSVSYLIGVQFGYFIRANNFGKDLNYGQIKKGMMDFINAEGNIQSPEFNDQLKISPDKMNELFNNFITKRNAYTAEVNQKKGEAFLESNKMKDNVVVTESGLQYTIIEEGNDVHPAEKDTVWVQYTGTLIDGTQFDASNKDNDPVRMLMNRVIKGWTEGLQYIGEGGHIKLFVPAELGYGARPSGSIEPNSTLIFDIELSKVGKVAAPAAPAEK